MNKMVYIINSINYQQIKEESEVCIYSAQSRCEE